MSLAAAFAEARPAEAGEAIELSERIAGIPADVLTNNFAQSLDVFTKFPTHDVLLAGNGAPRK